MNYIIFSKDRACQLDLLLRSMYKYVPTSINIVYIYSSIDFENGYIKLINKYDHNYHLNWIKQTNFRENVLNIARTSVSHCLGFLTDDSIFIDKFDLSDKELYDILISEGCNAFSTRCGLNTIKQCHYADIYQKNINPQSLNPKTPSNMIKWIYKEHPWEYNYGRPISLDGNIHPREILLKMLETQTFWSNPRQLDDLSFADLDPYMMSYKHNILINVPVNLAFGGCADNYSHFYSYPLEELNQRFLDGEQIKSLPDNFKDQDLNMAHMEIPYEFEKL